MSHGLTIAIQAIAISEFEVDTETRANTPLQAIPLVAAVLQLATRAVNPQVVLLRVGIAPVPLVFLLLPVQALQVVPVIPTRVVLPLAAIVHLPVVRRLRRSPRLLLRPCHRLRLTPRRSLRLALLPLLEEEGAVEEVI